MRLTISIPEAQTVDAPAVLRLIRMTPAYEVEAQEQGPAYVACFDDFPQSVDIVARLVEGACDLRDVRMTVDARPIVSGTKFYSALLCYRESLGVSDVEAHCARQAAKVGENGGCPDRSCASHCPFICSRCVRVAYERGAPPISVQLWEIARQAEVDWCPNLRIGKGQDRFS